jgi:beta propeller repeat protein
MNKLVIARYGLLILMLIQLGQFLGMSALDGGERVSASATRQEIQLTPAFPFPSDLALATGPGASPTPSAPFPTSSTPPSHSESQPSGPVATDWYVDASVSTSGDGLTPETAFKTIGEATAAAHSGDAIHVAAGIYTGTVSLADGVRMVGAGWHETAIDGGGTGTVLYASANSSIEGFTLTGSGPDFFDTAVWISVGPVTLRNNRFTNSQSGIFLWCFDPECPAMIEVINNGFDHNAYAGIATNGLHHFTVINNTFVDNGTALPATRSYQTIINNIVVNNTIGLSGETGHTPVAHHNLVWGNDVDYAIVGPGTGDVSADPLFADPDNDDYSLLPDSPGRDAGDPSVQYDDLDGTRNDMGTFGGPYLVDYTLPPTPLVQDRGDAQPFTTTLAIHWDGYDLQSGIVGYRAALGTLPAGDDTVGWTAVGTTTAYVFTDLNLSVGATYYASVQGQNGMGDWSAVGSSDGVLIDPAADDDLHPPLIANVAYSTPVHIDSPITVTASIHDQGEVLHGVFSATLFCGYEPPYDQTAVPGSGPGGSGDGLWRFFVPAQGAAHAGQRLFFWLSACDGDDSVACAGDDNEGQYYDVAVSADLDPQPFRVDHSPEQCDYADIDGGRVVYEDHRGPGIEVYGWDLDSDVEFMVIDDGPHQHFPVIHGDIVAYTDLRYSHTGLDGTDIFATDLTTGQEFTVTTAIGQQIGIAIGPRYIVWEDDRDGNTGSGAGSNRDIYGYDMLTGQEFPIATGMKGQVQPDIDGSRVVWSEDGDIVGRDLDAGVGFTVTTHAANQSRPAIRGDLVVWEDWRNWNWDIYAYRFSTEEEFPIAVAPGDQSFADISDELIVWQDMRHGNWDVYVHVIETGEQFAVTRNARKQKWPAVDGTTVVWSDFVNLEPQIYGFVYDGALPLSGNYTIQHNPTDLGVGAFPGGVIKLGWQDNTEEETGYVVERHTHMLGLDYQVVITLPANTEHYTDTDTQINVPYWYRVYAMNDAGRSATSNESYNLALPAEPYPNEQERYMQVLINQVRADPAAFSYPDYPAQPPVVYNPNLNYAARAHATVSVLPGGSGGHVDWADRGPGDRAVVSGFDHIYVSENMGGGGPTARDVEGANRMFLNSHGHRDNMLCAGTLETGLGYFYLWPERQGMWVETFGGRDGLTVPYLPAGAVAPFEGQPGDTYTYSVNYYHPDGLAPTTAQVIVDGVARDMTAATGSAGNTTYQCGVILDEGYDHTYTFQFAFPGGTARLPEMGAFSGPRVHGEMPDLDVTWLSVPSEPVLASAPIEISASVYNGGTVSAGDAVVRFTLGDPQAGGEPIGQVSATIAPHTGHRASITWTPVITGQHYVYAVADPDGLITESSEENNVRRSAITIAQREPFTAHISKLVAPAGQIEDSDLLTYTLIISATPGTQAALYDPLTDTTFLRFVPPLAGISHVGGIITGTLTITPAHQMTVGLVVQVAIPGAAGSAVTVTNRACAYPVGETLDRCVWSNEVKNPAFRPYDVLLPLVLRLYAAP